MTGSAIKPPTPKSLPDRLVEVPFTEIPKSPGGPDGPPVPSQVTLPNKKKTRADFREEEFSRVIGQHGKYVIWRKALLCPCHRDNTGQSAINCTVCDGSGYYYIDPLLIQAHMVQFDEDTKIFEKFGMWLEGAVSVTVLPNHRLGFRDSLEMRDSLMNFAEILTKGNRKGIRSVLPDGYDSARYRIVNIDRIGYLNTAGTVTFLEYGVHYKLSKDGWIEWTTSGDSLVPAGTNLSIRYEFHPVWVVTSAPHSIRDDTSGRKTDEERVVSLPLACAAKLDFLLNENDPIDPPVPVTGSL